MAERVTILDLRNGEWYAPDTTISPEAKARIDAAIYAGKRPKDIGMKRVGPWRENTWPEGSREAVYEL